MSAPGLAVTLSHDGSSSDDGCRIACPESLPLSRSVNATYQGLVPDFAMLTIPRPLRPTTRLDQWLTQEAPTNNERATSTVTSATPPADVANNATIIIEAIPALHGLFVYWEGMRISEDPLRTWNQGELYAQALARLLYLIGRSCRSPRTMDVAPVRIHAVDIEEQDRYPSFPRSAGADSIDSSSRYQPPDTTNHSHARRCQAVPDNDHAFIEDDTGAEIEQEDVGGQALLSRLHRSHDIPPVYYETRENRWLRLVHEFIQVVTGSHSNRDMSSRRISASAGTNLMSTVMSSPGPSNSVWCPSASVYPILIPRTRLPAAVWGLGYHPSRRTNLERKDSPLLARRTTLSPAWSTSTLTYLTHPPNITMDPTRRNAFCADIRPPADQVVFIDDHHPHSLKLAHFASPAPALEKPAMSTQPPSPFGEGQEQHSPTVLRAPRLRVKDLPDEDEADPYELEQAAVEDEMEVDTEKAAPAGQSDEAMDVDGPSCSGSATNGSDPRCTAHRSSGTSDGKSAANAQAVPTRRMPAAVPRSPVPSVISMLDQSVDLKCPFLSPTTPTSSGLFDDTSKKNKD